MENKTVAELSKELAAAVINSEEYRNYKSCQEELKKNPQLEVAVNELRRFNFELQNADYEGNKYDEVVKFFDRYANVRTNVAASRFLRAEMSLCRMLQEMLTNIFTDIDFDMDFLG